MPGSNPVIQANYFEDDEDRQVTGAIVDRLREVTAQGRSRPRSRSRSSRSGRAGPEQVVEFGKSPGITIYHAVGSAAMGPNDDDVVTPDPARARRRRTSRGGHLGAPGQVSGNTAAPAMAIGWRAADLIRSS